MPLICKILAHGILLQKPEWTKKRGKERNIILAQNMSYLVIKSI